MFKKLEIKPCDKANHRPVSVLPLSSKVFENFLNELLCGFLKAHFTQHALFRLIQRWQEELHSEGYVDTVLIDLPKVYDCLSHDFIDCKIRGIWIRCREP